MESINCIEVYIDGACSGNPGPGGWGVLIIKDSLHYEMGGSSPDTTNNIMEMTEALEALVEISNCSQPVTVFTDSQYLKKGISNWIHTWKFNNWKTSKGEEVKNIALWKEIDKLNNVNIRWEWVKGHADNKYNNRVDRIARSFAEGKYMELTQGKNPNESIETGIDETPKPGRKKSSKNKDKVYLSLVGSELGRHSAWDLCRARVHGISNAKFKACENPEEELETIKEWGLSPDTLSGIETDKIEIKTGRIIKESRISILIALPFIERFIRALEKKGFNEIKEGQDQDCRIFEKNSISVKTDNAGVFDFTGQIDNETLSLINKIKEADDREFDAFIKEPPLEFPKDPQCWGHTHFEEFLRPFFKGIVTRWKYRIENESITISDPGKPGESFDIETAHNYRWRKEPSTAVYQKILTSARGAVQFPDRLAISISGDPDVVMAVILIPLCRRNLRISQTRDWPYLDSAYYDFDLDERDRIKKQIFGNLENYRYMVFKKENSLDLSKDEKVETRFNQWTKKNIKEILYTLSIPQNIPVDLIIPDGEFEEIFDLQIINELFSINLRQPATVLEEKAGDFAQFMADRILDRERKKLVDIAGMMA